jgi:hypothetical protein
MSISVFEYGATPLQVNGASTHIQLVAGVAASTTEQFIDDSGVPIPPEAGYPRVTIYDGAAIVAQVLAYERIPNSGVWQADFTIPLDIEMSTSEKLLDLQWELRGINHEREKSKIIISVIGQHEESDTYDVIQMTPINGVQIVVPYVLSDSDIARLTLYSENTPVTTAAKNTITRRGASTVIDFGLQLQIADTKLVPYHVVIDLTVGSAPRQFFTQLYTTNPSILGALQSLDLSINKACQMEAIPGLRFRELDLLQGLMRGLDHFNSIGPSLTAFNGVNMCGPIREGWIICSTIKILRAHAMAEGWFNFDFSGANVSLNVDRTAAISDALSYYEGLTDTLLRPLKMQLARKGVISGDGAQGRNLAAFSQMGFTGFSNNPVSRTRLGAAGSYNQGRW